MHIGTSDIKRAAMHVHEKIVFHNDAEKSELLYVGAVQVISALLGDNSSKVFCNELQRLGNEEI